MSIYGTWLRFEAGALDEAERMNAIIGRDVVLERPSFDDDARGCTGALTSGLRAKIRAAGISA